MRRYALAVGAIIAAAIAIPGMGWLIFLIYTLFGKSLLALLLLLLTFAPILIVTLFVRDWRKATLYSSAIYGISLALFFLPSALAWADIRGWSLSHGGYRQLASAPPARGKTLQIQGDLVRSTACDNFCQQALFANAVERIVVARKGDRYAHTEAALYERRTDPAACGDAIRTIRRYLNWLPHGVCIVRIVGGKAITPDITIDISGERDARNVITRKRTLTAIGPQGIVATNNYYTASWPVPVPKPKLTYMWVTGFEFEREKGGGFEMPLSAFLSRALGLKFGVADAPAITARTDLSKLKQIPGDYADSQYRFLSREIREAPAEDFDVSVERARNAAASVTPQALSEMTKADAAKPAPSNRQRIRSWNLSLSKADRSISAEHSIGLLSRYGARAVPVLVDFLDRDEFVVRRSAARALSQCGPEGFAALEAIAKTASGKKRKDVSWALDEANGYY